jgi:hypothetical protein
MVKRMGRDVIVLRSLHGARYNILFGKCLLLIVGKEDPDYAHWPRYELLNSDRMLLWLCDHYIKIIYE